VGLDGYTSVDIYEQAVRSGNKYLPGRYTHTKYFDYRFEAGVTTITSSPHTPHLLAVGRYVLSPVARI
jgi:hypothetical protein